MKRIRLKLFIMILLILTLFGAELQVCAQPMNMIGPVSNLGQHPSTEMNFSWHTAVSVKNSVIEYYPDGSGTNFDTAKTVKVLARGVVSKTDADLRQVFKVELASLTPATQYVYRILNDGALAGPSSTFKTAGYFAQPYSFIQITDTQGFTEAHYALWANTLKQAQSQYSDARFLLHTGDFVDRGHEIWQWDQFVTAAHDDLMKLPLVPVVGNHEVTDSNGYNSRTKNFTERFNTPQVADTGAVPGTVYSFDYGAAHIAVMNTECGRDNFSKQAEWLRRDMAATQMPWKIVALHRSPYGALNNTVDIRSAWVSVFDELKIDVVLAGHDHSYARSPMKYGKRVKTGEGTTYIVANAGGVKFYPGKARYWQVLNFQTYRQMYLGVTVDPSTLNIRAYDVRNQLLDEVTFKK